MFPFSVKKQEVEYARNVKDLLFLSFEEFVFNEGHESAWSLLLHSKRNNITPNTFARCGLPRMDFRTRGQYSSIKIFLFYSCSVCYFGTRASCFIVLIQTCCVEGRRYQQCGHHVWWCFKFYLHHFEFVFFSWCTFIWWCKKLNDYLLI